MVDDAKRLETDTDMVLDDTMAGEVATVIMDGQRHEATGFHVDLETGRMLAYVTRVGAELWLTTWGGAPLVQIEQTGVCAGFHDGKIYSYRTRARYMGRHWHGRGAGEGMLLRLRAESGRRR